MFYQLSPWCRHGECHFQTTASPAMSGGALRMPPLALQTQNGTSAALGALPSHGSCYLISSRELVFNSLSLACGFAGNLFLLLHFTSRVRYIIALPVAILCWLLSA